MQSYIRIPQIWFMKLFILLSESHETVQRENAADSNPTHAFYYGLCHLNTSGEKSLNSGSTTCMFKFGKCPSTTGCNCVHKNIDIKQKLCWNPYRPEIQYIQTLCYRHFIYSSKREQFSRLWSLSIRRKVLWLCQVSSDHIFSYNFWDNMLQYHIWTYLIIKEVW